MRISKVNMNVYPFQKICSTVCLSLTFLFFFFFAVLFLYCTSLYHPNYHILNFTYLSKMTTTIKKTKKNLINNWIPLHADTILNTGEWISSIPSNKLWAGKCGWLWVVKVVENRKSKYNTNSSPRGSFPKMKCIMQWGNINSESQFWTIKAEWQRAQSSSLKWV